jgi:Cu(I)/Ag(I) efflux system periplasmic protein CusF
MLFRIQRILAVGLVPIALSGCAEIEPATAQSTSMTPGLGVDLGNSARVPQIAGLAGEGEGYGRTEPGPGPAPMAHGSMPGMAHGAGMPTDQTLMAGMDRSGMQMDHGSMPGMTHASATGMPAGHGAMVGMRHRAQRKMASAHGSMPGMRHGSGKQGMQMAHSGHAHAQGIGTVNSVDAAEHKVNVSHGPISSIGLPAMTMDFAVAPSVDLRAMQPGSRINFTIEQDQGGSYVIQSITPTEGGRK